MQTSLKQVCRRPTSGQHGFTLVELLVTVAVLAVIVALGIPSFTDALRGWQRDVATRSFTSHVQMARTEAIKTSRQVVMCASTNGTSCSGSDNWGTGWVVFVDTDEDEAVGADDRVLAVQGELRGLKRMEANNNRDFFFFLPSGLMPASQSTLRIEPLGSASLKQNAVTITSTGRVSVKTEDKGT